MILARSWSKKNRHGRGSAGILLVLTQEGPAVLRIQGRARSRRDAGATEAVASTLETSWRLCHCPKSVEFDARVRALIGCVAMYRKLFQCSDIAGRL